jgi:glycosyltransferase involved in cell wall biosynthesis
MTKEVVIQGVRGIPAAHGGFETFAEYLSLYLVSKGWRVVVYCQLDKSKTDFKIYQEDDWRGVRRIFVPVRDNGALGTILFDFLSILHILTHRYRCVLTLGYNTAIFNILLRVFGRLNIINMDGLEWMRSKWSIFHKIYLYINERIACYVGSVLIADHPEIQLHLEQRVNAKKIRMIPYGARSILDVSDQSILKLGLTPNTYAIVVARPEPENSILEIVEAFSRTRRGVKLVVLGKFDASNKYHSEVQGAASPDVIFLGAIYDKLIVDSLRSHALCYIHGHTVGGTNPSLVEAMGAGQAIIAHDNKFNRWVADDSAMYFGTVDDCADVFDLFLSRPDLIEKLKVRASSRFESLFTWESVLFQYESLLLEYLNE